MLWLRHKNGATVVSMRFREMFIRSSDFVERKGGKTLLGNVYDHRLFQNKTYTVIISADETFGLTSTKRDFCRNFWTAGERFINFDTGASEPSTGWIAVATDGGATPVSFLEDNDYLAEFTFNLTAKEAV